MNGVDILDGGWSVEVILKLWVFNDKKKPAKGMSRKNIWDRTEKCKGPEVIQKQQEGNMKGQKHGMRVREM